MEKNLFKQEPSSGMSQSSRFLANMSMADGRADTTAPRTSTPLQMRNTLEVSEAIRHLQLSDTINSAQRRNESDFRSLEQKLERMASDHHREAQELKTRQEKLSSDMNNGFLLQSKELNSLKMKQDNLMSEQKRAVNDMKTELVNKMDREMRDMRDEQSRLYQDVLAKFENLAAMIRDSNYPPAAAMGYVPNPLHHQPIYNQPPQGFVSVTQQQPVTQNQVRLSDIVSTAPMLDQSIRGQPPVAAVASVKAAAAAAKKELDQPKIGTKPQATQVIKKTTATTVVAAETKQPPLLPTPQQTVNKPTSYNWAPKATTKPPTTAPPQVVKKEETKKEPAEKPATAEVKPLPASAIFKPAPISQSQAQSQGAGFKFGQAASLIQEVEKKDDQAALFKPKPPAAGAGEQKPFGQIFGTGVVTTGGPAKTAEMTTTGFGGGGSLKPQESEKPSIFGSATSGSQPFTFGTGNSAVDASSLFRSVGAPVAGFTPQQSRGFPGAGKMLFGSGDTGGTPDADRTGAGEGNDECPEDYNPTDDFIKPDIKLPELVDVKTGEENEEVMFCHRAKLYRFDEATKEQKERGLGDLKILKNGNTGRFRIVMRREQVHKLCANHYLDGNMSLAPMANNDKAYMWHCMDFADGEQKHELLTARFKTAEKALEFKNAFDRAIGKESSLDNPNRKVQNSAAAASNGPSSTPKFGTPEGTAGPPTSPENFSFKSFGRSADNSTDSGGKNTSFGGGI